MFQATVTACSMALVQCSTRMDSSNSWLCHRATSPTATTALIDEVSLTLPCPKKVICRSGDWFHADIPGTFDPPLAFPLRWDRTVIPSSRSTCATSAAMSSSSFGTSCLPRWTIVTASYGGPIAGP